MEIILLPNQMLEINLPLSGYSLIPGYFSGQFGLPIELYLRLYAVKDKEKMLVSDPDSLSRYVSHIDSKDAAWCFLSLFTAPETHFLFQKEIYTVDLCVSSGGSTVDTAMISQEVA